MHIKRVVGIGWAAGIILHGALCARQLSDTVHSRSATASAAFNDAVATGVKMAISKPHAVLATPADEGVSSNRSTFSDGANHTDITAEDFRYIDGQGHCDGSLCSVHGIYVQICLLTADSNA